MEKQCLFETLKNISKNYNFVVISHFVGDYKSNLENSGSDLDILCDSKRTVKKIAKLIGGQKIQKYIFSNSYWVKYNERLIPVDMFFVGDAFYPKPREKKMLKNKIFDKNGIPFLNSEDNKYSCCYHGFFHKKELTNSYLQKIAFFFNQNNVNESLFLEDLLSFMDKNNFYFTITLDKKRMGKTFLAMK